MDEKSERGEINFDHLDIDTESIKRSLANRLTYTVGKDQFTATERDWFHTTAYTVRDRLIERWMETMRSYYEKDAKRIYYLSLEFLIGRTLTNSLLNLDFHEPCREALQEMGYELERIREIEDDAALGNGGLGRLAACFLDSMATLCLPGYGYGIRYEYGMFKQQIRNGWQVEHPENWLRYGNPWEYARPEVLFNVKFKGRVVQYKDEEGRNHHHWIDTEEVMAMAYDTPIPGYKNDSVNNMRLWSAKGSRDFDLNYFNQGDYIMAVEEKNISENLSRVLYPNDTTVMGRELRLQQEYFFVSASLQDILFRFQKHHDNITELPDKVAVQLNDTHPAIAVPEMMHLLVDHHQLEWKEAWSITTRTFSYTNHTLLPEALETWPVALFGRMLPRHLQIIQEINRRFLNDVMHTHPGDAGLLSRMSIFSEDGEQHIRMAHLAIVGSHHVNGVAALHTELMKETIFADFHSFYPEKIINITNGITPRRWLNQANPQLSQLITEMIGTKWTTHLDELKKLEPFAEDAEFRRRFHAVKQANKKRLVELIKQHLEIEVRTDSLFDVQIKRIHEYKRQLLNLLHVVTLYNRIRSGQGDEIVPRTIIMSGKAAPGYATAKLIIKLANDIADIINHDPAVGDLLRVVFVPNYDVSTALDIIPAAELSEQISTAGMEASGTGNMKLALNGALTIGTLDGANVEIRDEVGEENIFIFGHTTDSVKQLRQQGYNPQQPIEASKELQQVLEMIDSGFFSPDDPTRYKPLLETLRREDHYLVLDDYADYIACQQRVEALYRDSEAWDRSAILNVANMGHFSSDRSIRDYAEKIWGVKPVCRQSCD
ncbi:glycogen phosphorylase [Solemya pervernicosa gill symbiont]|uniref:Alpha-1,4 glucan phosphorylase n=2 Tax=Gammaproteobacteria incertae sedis TaxID=118884 RepID=A0A1T2L974_9GAMM|nr:glycogen/starch/alpha-glucan phosphorylase [Candidatus Reidiella endopervernicosa]OOZ41582.1 glycogen phosphorylase [Solemya pervernicosa gill symbiont]QKQ27987.1 glycogen/starch/alpha-glucan phosphorylase [Candidatus Reidiella endopervernicosa]